MTGGKRVNSGRKRLYRDFQMRVTTSEHMLINALREQKINPLSVIEDLTELYWHEQKL